MSDRSSAVAIRTPEQLAQLRALRAEVSASGDRLARGGLSPGDHLIERARLVDLHQQLLAAEPPLPRAPATFTPAEASARAKEIRRMPAYWRDEYLVREAHDLDLRAADGA